VVKPSLSKQTPPASSDAQAPPVYLVTACDGTVVLTGRLDRARAEYCVQWELFRQEVGRHRTVDLLTL
jgi:hypothetical protein